MRYTLAVVFLVSSTFLNTKQLLTLMSLWYELSYSKDRNVGEKTMQ